jgi:azurin
MKKALLSVMFMILTISSMVLAQTLPTYEARLKNDIQVSPNVYEFDIFLKRTGTQPYMEHRFV